MNNIYLKKHILISNSKIITKQINNNNMSNYINNNNTSNYINKNMSISDDKLYFHSSPSILNSANLLKYKILGNPIYKKLSINIIFGCYNIDRDLKNILSANKINKIIFGGSDVYYKMRDISQDVLKYLRSINNDKIQLYSISNFINSDLDDFNLKYRQLYLCLASHNNFYNLNKTKTHIYIYDGDGNINRINVYNINLINDILKKIKFNYYKSSTNKVKYNEMNNLLNRCFVGLRLTKHDGNSNIVQEMGLIGIKCIHNSYFYNSIPFNSITDIVANINIEYDKYTDGYIDNATPYICKLNSINCTELDIFDNNDYNDDIVTVILYTCNDTEKKFCDSLKTILFQHMIKTKIIISTVFNDNSIKCYNKYFKNNYRNIQLITTDVRIDKCTKNIENILIGNGLKYINTRWLFILSTNEVCYAFKCYKEIKKLKENNKKICISNYDIIKYDNNSENIINYIIHEINNKESSLISMMHIDMLNKYLKNGFDPSKNIIDNKNDIFKRIFDDNIDILHYTNPTYVFKCESA